MLLMIFARFSRSNWHPSMRVNPSNLHSVSGCVLLAEIQVFERARLHGLKFARMAANQRAGILGLVRAISEPTSA